MRAAAGLAVVLVVACTKSEPPPEPAPPKPEPAPAPVKMAAAGDGGTCTLGATGAFTADETIGGSTASSTYWMSDAEKAGRPTGFVLNCAGKQLRLSIAANPNTTVPFGPKTYKLAGKNPELALLGRAGKSLQDFAGTIEVTAFDGHHIAGTIDVNAKQIGGGAVKLAGSFDLPRSSH